MTTANLLLLRDRAVLATLPLNEIHYEEKLLRQAVATHPNLLFQYSTTDALLAGVIEGEYRVGELLEKGNFGLGIHDALDGELLVLDGQAYRLNTDRTVDIVTDDVKVPFCSMCEFEEEDAEALDIMATRYDAFKSELDTKLLTLNYPYAIKITGVFREMMVRSMPRQIRPYAPFSEIMEKKVIMDFNDVEGVIVGFRFPTYLSGINTPGYHFHFITADKASGGHVMNFEIEAAEILVQKLSELDILLPDDDTFGQVDFSVDRSYELKNALNLKTDQ